MVEWWTLATTSLYLVKKSNREIALKFGPPPPDFARWARGCPLLALRTESGHPRQGLASFRSSAPVPGSRWATLPCAVAFSALVGWVFSMLTLKFRNETFVLATIGFQMIVYLVLYNCNGLTHGPYGISGIPRPSLFGLAVESTKGYFAFCGIAFAQYVRGDFDYSKSFRIDKNNSVAFHTALGIACPYGNSDQLPFEKRYFAGGANSVRGWSVRSLGPGAYNGKDKGINFLNQSGDIKFDLNLEYRAALFWKFSGAAFVDAGNIWTIKKYKDQPDGEFRIDKFWKQIALSYGIGLRMDANFFIVRFDAGMKAIDPAYTGHDHYPITHHSFNRDFAFHFAVGLPF